MDEQQKNESSLDAQNRDTNLGAFSQSGAQTNAPRGLLSEDDLLDKPKSTLMELIVENESGGEQAQPVEIKKRFDVAEEIAKLQLRDKYYAFLGFFDNNPYIMNTINSIWAVGMVTICTIGMLFAVLAFVTWFAFTPIVRGYLYRQGIEGVTFTTAEHTLDRIVLTNVRDRNDLFSIKSLRLQYDLARILKREITVASVEGLVISLDKDSEKTFNLPDFTRFLTMTSILNRVLRIQTLDISDSQILIGKKKIPLHFSGIASIQKANNLAFKNAYINAPKASLDSSTNEWRLSLTDTELTFPEYPAVKVSGSLTLRSRSKTEAELEANFTTQGAHPEKNIDLVISPNRNGRIDIKSVVAFLEPAYEKSPTILEMTFQDLEFDQNFSALRTNQPIDIKVRNFRSDLFNADSVQGQLVGNLACQDNACQYRLLKPAAVTVFAPKKQIGDVLIHATYPVKLTLLLGNDNLMDLTPSHLVFKAQIKKDSFSLNKLLPDSTLIPIALKTDDIYLEADANLSTREETFFISSPKTNYSDNALQIKDGDINIETRQQATTMSIVSPQVQLLNNDLLKVPVALNMQFTSSSFKGELETLDKQVRLRGYGNFDVKTGEFSTFLASNLIAFSKRTKQPQELSSVFDKTIRNLDGKVQIYGKIHFKHSRNISGPLKILLDRVSFDYGDINVQKMSSVLNVQSFVPFSTDIDQRVFIQTLNATLPFEGVDMIFHVNSKKQQMNISKLHASVAGVPLRISPMWVNFPSASYPFTFKVPNLDLETIALNVPDLALSGKGTLTLSLAEEGHRIALKTLEWVSSEPGLLSYTPPDAQKKNYKSLSNLAFRKASFMLTELDNHTFDFLMLAQTKTIKTPNTTLKIKIAPPLSRFITMGKKRAVPSSIVEQQAEFQSVVQNTDVLAWASERKQNQ
ncbi:MAG: hypothetical protein ILP11_00335 [Alphaproteobacteria bacterium]|nr:hypothetical protein [Alphaproteobacteria bacterium]